MEYKDYYKSLDIDKTAETEAIEKAYRKLARRYHPDINPGDAAAADRYMEINEAQQVLTQKQAKEKYDRLGESWTTFQQSDTQEDFDWRPWVAEIYKTGSTRIDLDEILNQVNSNGQWKHSDFFEIIFGDLSGDQAQDDAGAGTDADPTPRRGEDLHHQVEISLEEAFSGVSRILRIAERRLEVKIPRGAQTGTKVRVRGEGNDGVNGGPKGDLYLEIIITPDPIFNRVGDDLHIDLPVNVYSAVLGGEAIVSTMKGKIKLRIPPETQSGRVFRIKGQGMPSLKNPEKRGELYAKVMITVPEGLTELEIELFEELADLRGL